MATDVKVYSLKAEGNNRITTHFQVHEFACEDGSDPVFISTKLVEILEQIRQHFGQAVTITSGYRTVSHNATIPNSSKKSQHLFGLAADIKVNGYSPETVYAYAETLLPGTGGIGIYDTIVHVDVRKSKSRWDYRTKK